MTSELYSVSKGLYRPEVLVAQRYRLIGPVVRFRPIALWVLIIPSLLVLWCACLIPRAQYQPVLRASLLEASAGAYLVSVTYASAHLRPGILVRDIVDVGTVRNDLRMRGVVQSTNSIPCAVNQICERIQIAMPSPLEVEPCQQCLLIYAPPKKLVSVDFMRIH